MKAFLLAAGEGTRLRPLTDSIPKCLVPIRGVPLLGIWFDLCRSFGIDQMLVNLHWKAESVRRFVEENGYQDRVKLVYEETLLGSAGTIYANWDWVKGEECFWILYADVLTNVNLARMEVFHRQQRAEFTMGVVTTGEPHRCGIAEIVNSRVVSFEEKPREPKSNLAFSGVFLASPALYSFLPATAPADLGHDVIPRLAGRMSAYEMREYLADIGTHANYARAQETWPGLQSAAGSGFST